MHGVDQTSCGILAQLFVHVVGPVSYGFLFASVVDPIGGGELLSVCSVGHRLLVDPVGTLR